MAIPETPGNPELQETPFEKTRHKLVSARIELMSRLARFGHDELTLAPNPGEWSALEVAYHVYIADGVALEQLQQVQEEDNPEVAEIEKEAQRLTLGSQPPVSLDAVLAGMAARREELFEYLNTLAPEAWERPLRHDAWGPLKFYQLVNVLPKHDQLHARQLEELKTALTPVQP